MGPPQQASDRSGGTRTTAVQAKCSDAVGPPWPPSDTGESRSRVSGGLGEEPLLITLRWSRPLRRRAEQGENLASSGRHAKLSRAGSPAGAQLVCTAKARGEAGSLRVSAVPYQSRQLRCPGPSQARWTLKTPAGCRSLPETTSRPNVCVSVE